MHVNIYIHYRLSKLSTTLTQAEFYNIVEFLFSTIWSESFKLSSFSDNAEGVLCVARLLKYPFPLTKSVLTSLARHHTPTLIGFLGWLAELVEIDLANGIGPTTARKSDDEMPVDQLWLRYLTNSFRERRSAEAVAAIDADFVAQLQRHIETAQAAADELEARAAEVRDSLAAERQKAEDAALEEADARHRAEVHRTDIPKLQALIATLDTQRSEQEMACNSKVGACTAAIERCEALEKTLGELRNAVSGRGISPQDHSRAVSERNAAQRELAAAADMLGVRAGSAEDARIVHMQAAADLNAKLLKLKSLLALLGGKAPVVSVSTLEQDERTGVLSTDALLQAHASLKTVVKPAVKNRAASIAAKRTEVERTRVRLEELAIRVEGELADARKALEAREAEWKRAERAVEAEASSLRAEVSEYEAEAQRARAESRGFADNAANALAEARRLHEDAIKSEGHRLDRRKQCKSDYVESLYYLCEALVEHKDSVEKALQYLKEQSEHLLSTLERESAKESDALKEEEEEYDMEKNKE